MHDRTYKLIYRFSKYFLLLFCSLLLFLLRLFPLLLQILPFLFSLFFFCKPIKYKFFSSTIRKKDNFVSSFVSLKEIKLKGFCNFYWFQFVGLILNGFIRFFFLCLYSCAFNKIILCECICKGCRRRRRRRGADELSTIPRREWVCALRLGNHGERGEFG